MHPVLRNGIILLVSTPHHISLRMKPKNEPGIPQWRGDALRLRRIAAGWKIKELAERIGVSKTTNIPWEHGENAPNSGHVRCLAQALGVEVAAFSKAPRIV